MKRQLTEDEYSELKGLSHKELYERFDEDDAKSIGENLRVRKYADTYNDMRIDEGSSQPYQHLNRLIKDKLPMAMKDTKWFQPHFRNLKNNKISMFEFLALFLQYLNEKKLAQQLGLDNPFLMASAARTATNIIRQHIRNS